MNIAEPETDINLWISIVSQSLQIPVQLYNCKQQLDQVFSDIIEDEKSFTNKYRISTQDFYYSIQKNILCPLLKLNEIQDSNEIDMNSLISELLISFVKLAVTYLNKDDDYLRDMLLLLFQQNNNLYQLNYQFYQDVCDNFIYSGYFADFLNYAENIMKIPDTLNSPPSSTDDNDVTEQTTQLTEMMKKLPYLSKIEMKHISYITDEPDFEYKTFCFKFMDPLLRFSRFSSDFIAYEVFTTIMNDEESFQIDIINRWLVIFKAYVLSGGFSLTHFAIRAMSFLIRDEHSNQILFELLLQGENHEIVSLFLKIPIRLEFAEFLKVIFSSFLEKKVISIDKLLPIWETRKTLHVSVRSSFYSIFEEASRKVPFDEIAKFTQMVLTNIVFTKEWLNFIVNCALNLNQRNVDVSNYVNLLKLVNDENFDFLDSNQDSFNTNEISNYKQIAENGLSRLLVGSFDMSNFSGFMNEISTKIDNGKETDKDIEILYQTLTKFSNSKVNLYQISPQFLTKIISIFNRHKINTMEEIVRVLISDSFGYHFDEKMIRMLLSFTLNEKLSSNVYAFLSELCLVLNQIPIDLLLQEMMSNRYLLDKNFYKTIKSIILNLNNGGNEITSFPFVQENVIWHFCYFPNKQNLRFQHFLSRLYMRNATSDEEMIQSFLTNWINGFKLYYYGKKDDEEYQNEILEQYLDFLNIFIKKIEFYIHTPIKYHFSEYKTNKVQILIDTFNGEKDDYFSHPFYFDQRRSVSSLAQYIKIRFNLQSNLEIFYDNSSLNERCIFQEEVGVDTISQVKDNGGPLFISIMEIHSHPKNGKKPLYVRQDRTMFPSRYIVDKFSGLSEIIFESSKYQKIIYNLPTFNETLATVKSLKSDDFQSFFPYNNPNKFRYNFESFLDYYSSQEYDLLSEDQIINNNKSGIFYNSFVRKSGIIDYFISCGLSMEDEKLVNMILIFLRDYSTVNKEVLENEILKEQLMNMIQQFLEDPKSISKSIISTVFTFKLKSIPNFTKDQLYDLFIKNKSELISKGAREFLKEVPLPLSYYSYTYDKSDFEPCEMFYSSWADHILLSNSKDKRTNAIIFINLQKTNASSPYLRCIEAVLKKKMLSNDEINRVANYIADCFINEQIMLPPKPGFNLAIQIASFLNFQCINEAICRVLVAVNNFSLLHEALTYNHSEDDDEEPMFNGDFLRFRRFSTTQKSIEVNSEEYPIGLINLGATCYINVILQQLYNITDFRNELSTICSTKIKDPNEPNSKMILALNELFNELQHSYLSVANPSRFIQAFGGINVNIHNDCSEFFDQLIDRLNIDLFKCKFKHIISAIDDEDTFVETFEDFTVLPLSIQGISNIDESFDHLFEADYFTGDNGYIFEDGRGKVDAKKSAHIQSLSKHLIVQLERFEYNHRTQMKEKISSFFEFNDSMYINDKFFILTGVIIHLGETADSGHYISYVRKAETTDSRVKSYTNDWFQCNDSNVRSVSQENVMEDGYVNGYLLFYTQTDSSVLNASPSERIFQINKESVVCRMIFSSSFFEAMIDLIRSEKYQRMSLSLFYYFKYLCFYDDQKSQDKFGKIILSFLKEKSEKSDQLFNIIAQIWNQLQLEIPLLNAKWCCMRHNTSLILKEVIQRIDCFNNLNQLMVDACPSLYRLFYSSSNFFELVNFALQNYQENMLELIRANGVDEQFLSLFRRIVNNRNNIEFECAEMHDFLEILTTIGISEDVEAVICENVEVFEDFFRSQTPVEDIANFIMNMNRRNEVIESLEQLENASDKLMELLAQLK